MWHAYGNAHIHSDSDCDGDGNGHSYSYSYAYADCDCYGNCHIHANSDGDILHSNRDSNCDGDRIAAAFTDATASSDTAAPTVRPAGCSLVWELASEPREFPDSIVVTSPFVRWQTTSQP